MRSPWSSLQARHCCTTGFSGADYQGKERLIWIDREGNKTPTSEHDGMIRQARVSLDGRRAVLEIFEPGRTNLWMLEFGRDSLTRFSFDELADRNPVWSPDSDWVIFGSFRGGASTNLFRKRSNGTGEVERLTESTQHHDATSWSPDGTTVAFVEQNRDTGADILLLRLGSEPPETEVFLRTPFNEANPQISTDGKWIAYNSDESGEREVYVRPLSGSGGQVKVSTNGGAWMVWSPDGDELIYHDDEADKLMSVPFKVEGGEFRPGLARVILDYPKSYGSRFDVERGTGRILTDEDPQPQGTTPPPTVVVNWFADLEQKVPAR